MTGRRFALGELARSCGAALVPAPGTSIVDASALVAEGVAGLDEAGPAAVTFFANRAYARKLAASKALAVFCAPDDVSHPGLASRHRLVHPQPYAAFAKASAAFHPVPPVVAGVDVMARIEAGAEVDPSARVEAFAFVAAGAVVGARAHLFPGSYVGRGARVGEDSVLGPNVVVREGCVVGARCLLHAGAVVGADGFGFAFDPMGDGDGPMHRKVPQVGIAVLEDDVELGANTCVDRATFGETRIGRGTKLDNLVQVAHNVRIGPLTVMAAQSGIAGSTTLGAGVQVGGQAGIVGHIAVGDLAKVAATAAVMQDVDDGATVQGVPAHDLADWRREQAALRRLPKLLHEVRRLEERLAALEAGGGGGKKVDS